MTCTISALINAFNTKGSISKISKISPCRNNLTIMIDELCEEYLIVEWKKISKSELYFTINSNNKGYMHHVVKYL